MALGKVHKYYAYSPAVSSGEELPYGGAKNEVEAWGRGDLTTGTIKSIYALLVSLTDTLNRHYSLPWTERATRTGTKMGSNLLRPVYPDHALTSMTSE